MRLGLGSVIRREYLALCHTLLRSSRSEHSWNNTLERNEDIYAVRTVLQLKTTDDYECVARSVR